MPSLELSLGEEDDASAQASSSSTTTTPRRRTLINFRMKRIALGVRKIFSKQDSSSALVPNTGSSSGLPPLSPSHRNLTNKFRLQRTKSNAALTTERDIFPPISEMWTNKTFVDLPCAKDIPRLVRRVVVTVSGDDAAVFSAPSVVDDADTSLKRSLVLTAELVVALCARLDSREKADQVGKDMAVLVQDCNDQTDAEETVRQFISLLGEEKDSRTIRVLKTINQDLVAHCTCELKEHITSRFMTKDVRTPEGWRIVIQLPKEEAGAGIQVVHTRREQSIDLGGDVRNHWEFEWELKLLLDSGAGEMKQAQLRVTDLFLSETIDPKLESQIKHDLRVGENII